MTPTAKQLAREMAERCAEKLLLSLSLSTKDRMTNTILRELNLESLVEDRERLNWVLECIHLHGTEGISEMPWTVIEEDGEDSDIAFDRAAIDAAMKRKEQL